MKLWLQMNGSTYQNVSIVYEQEIPCNEPAINFIRPLGTGVGIPSTTASNFHLSFNVLEIATKVEIIKIKWDKYSFDFDTQEKCKLMWCWFRN